MYLLWKMNSDRRTHSCQQDLGRRAAVSVASFPCSMEMASESKEVNELNQCSRLATAGGKEQPGPGEGFSAGSWAELTAGPGWCKRTAANGSMELPETPSFPENKTGQLL